YRRSGQALRLLPDNGDGKAEPEDERVRALVLAMRPGDRRKAIGTLEESFARLRPTPYERFLLARLYEMDRKNPRANQLFLELLTTPEGRENTFFVAHYIGFLTRTGDLPRAEQWLAALREREPGRARTVELEARLRKEQGRGGEVPGLI